MNTVPADPPVTQSLTPLDSRVTLHQRHGWDRPDGRRRGFETAWGIATYGGMTRFGVYEEDAVLRLPPGASSQARIASTQRPVTILNINSAVFNVRQES